MNLTCAVRTLDTAWNTLKTETESIASYHQTFADTLSSQVDDSLKQWLGETQKQRKAVKNFTTIFPILIPV